MKLSKSFLAVALALLTLFCAGRFTTAADNYDLYPITENRLLAGKTVIIDAGHGLGNTNGTGGYLEEEGNFIQAVLLKDNLERCGAKVIMTRPTREDVDSCKRMAIVNKTALEAIRQQYMNENETQREILELNRLITAMELVIADPEEYGSIYFNEPWDRNRQIADTTKRIFEYENCSLIRKDFLFISIHSNDYDVESAHGTESYYMSNDCPRNKNYYRNYSYVDTSYEFADYLAQEVSTAGEFYNRGVKTDKFFMIRELNMPSALIEMAFNTNNSDRAKLMSERYQKRMASGMTYAVMKHFGVYTDPSLIEYTPPAGPGDANCDGAIDNVDVVTIARYLARLPVDIDLEYADADLDGIVANPDLVLVARMVIGLA